MNYTIPRPRRWVTWLAAVFLLGCGEHAPTDPGADLALRQAKGSGGGGGGVTVKSANPSSGSVSTTLAVRLLGSGFASGSKAVWALNGDTTHAVTRVRTNSTAFVSSTELIANITIDGEATLDRYDIMVVTPTGKKGIGIELFEVIPLIIDLGAAGGSIAYAVNDLGQVVGDGGSGMNAFLWENGVLRDLGVLPGHVDSYASDINESGQVVGTSYDGSSGSRAFIWTEAAGMQALPGTLGGTSTEAWAINESGEVIGAAYLAGDSVHHAVMWRNGGIIDLQSPTFSSGTSYAWEINDFGESVGVYYPAGLGGGGGNVGWRNGSGMQLLWAGATSDWGEALGINNHGTIVGWRPAVAGQPPTAYTWTNGVFLHLGTLGGTTSVAMAVNDLGAVVGRADKAPRRGSTSQAAFIWTPSTGMRDLGLPTGRDRGWAMDINETGSVVGQTSGANSSSRATLWRFQ